MMELLRYFLVVVWVEMSEVGKLAWMLVCCSSCPNCKCFKLPPFYSFKGLISQIFWGKIENENCCFSKDVLVTASGSFKFATKQIPIKLVGIYVKHLCKMTVFYLNFSFFSSCGNTVKMSSIYPKFCCSFLDSY